MRTKTLIRYGLRAAVVLLLVAAMVPRLVNRAGYDNPDEKITVKVITHMEASGDYDTNWAKADLPSYFKYDQYNFSSYIYAAWLFSKLVRVADLPGYRLFSGVCACLSLVVLVLLGRKTSDMPVFVCALVLAAAAPILVQDAHYGRPEAFATLLTLGITCLSWPGRKFQPLAACGAAFLAGLLMACKISMVFFVWMPFVPACFFFLKAQGPAARRATTRAAVLLPLVMAAGFCAGVPGAILEPGRYLHGIMELFRQYNGIHPGHSHMSGGLVADLLTGYLGATLGWPLMALFAIGLIVKTKQRAWLPLLLIYFPAMFFIAYFSYKSVFFERNLSHIMPHYIIGAAYGIGAFTSIIKKSWPAARLLRAALACLLLAASAAAPCYYSYQLVANVFSGKDQAERRAYDKKLRKLYRAPRPWRGFLLSAEDLKAVDTFLRKGKPPKVVCVYDLGDDITAFYLKKLYELYAPISIGTYPGLFEAVPHCTLQAYHSCTLRYFLVTQELPDIATEQQNAPDLYMDNNTVLFLP